MWPNDLEIWLVQYQDRYRPPILGQDQFTTEQRLFQYPPLCDYSHQIAREAADKTRRIAREELINCDDLFDRNQFFRWLRLTTPREALRVVLDRDPVEKVMRQLPVDQQRLLLLRYVVQVTDLEVAQVFNLRDRSRLYDAAAAQRLSREAYHALCRQLATVLNLPRPAASVSSIFPVYPGY